MARIQELTLARGNRGLLLLAVLSGLVAAALVFVALARNDGGDETVSPATATAKVVVAGRDIAVGSEVTADMLKVVDVPESLLVKGAFASAAPVVGEVTRVALAEGEQITPSKVGAAAAGKGLGSVVPKGKRAVAIRVEEATAVGGLLLPGDRVDVVAAFQEGETPVVVQTVLQDIEVLAVAQEAQRPVPVTTENEGGGTTKDLAVAILNLNPDFAEPLRHSVGGFERSQTVLKARMKSPRENIVRQGQLLYPTKTLKNGSVDYPSVVFRYPDQTMNWISYCLLELQGETPKVQYPATA